MSAKQVKSLIEKMKKDEKFKRKILAIKNLEDRIQAIKKEGFNCSMADIQSFLDNNTKMEEEDRGLITNFAKGCIAKGLPGIKCTCDMM